MILGITGGIGCGKSTAAALFERRGFMRLDSDAIIRDEVLASAEVQAALRGRYGDDVVKPDATVDRARLAAHVFSAEAELRWLEALTHPLLFAQWRSRFAAAPNAD